MDERSSGIVLRTRPLTESSLIVHWITSDLGRIGTVAKGARRPKSPFRGKIDLFYTAEFMFARSRRSDLHILREVSLRTTRDALRRELGHLNQAAYCARLIEQTTETETPLPVIYQLFEGFLDTLAVCKDRDRQVADRKVLAFEAKLLRELGLSPQEGKMAELVKSLAASPWAEIQSRALTETELRELRQFLHGFLIYHLGKIPPNRSRAIAPTLGP